MGAKIYVPGCSSQPCLWGRKTENSLKVRQRDWLNKLWCIHVMEYHTAIKNDGPVKEYLTTWGNVHKILLRTGEKKKSRLQNSKLHMPLTLLKQLLKKKAQGPWGYLWYCFAASKTPASLIPISVWAQRKACAFSVWRSDVESSLGYFFTGWPWSCRPHFSSSIKWG